MLDSGEDVISQLRDEWGEHRPGPYDRSFFDRRTDAVINDLARAILYLAERVEALEGGAK